MPRTGVDRYGQGVGMNRETDFIGLTAREIAGGVNDGRWSAEAATRAFLDRCSALEDRLRAWAALDPDLAIEQARAIDRTIERGDRHQPLAGVPVGVKDIFATADLPTEYGSPIYTGNRPQVDAACVALSRASGAVILGKTATTEFAANNPTATRNPHDPGRTPGGSSSGSAAAVAAGAASVAIGTQTAGSVIRPASYCGVVAYKPTFGYSPRAGLKPSANSLDTLGFFARNVGDVALFSSLSSGRKPFPKYDDPDPAPRFALCRTAEWSAMESGTQEALESCVDAIRSAGAIVSDISLPETFNGLADAHWTVMAYETTRSLTWERINHPDLLSEKLQAIFELGESISDEDYGKARVLGSQCRSRLDDMLGKAEIDVLLGPAAPGEAPEGLESTGDPILNRVWTFLHVPCMSLPLLTGPAGLPLGLQAIARSGRDWQLMRAAAWLEDRLPYSGAPDDPIA
ncbi:MAG: amidase [Rhodospirillaceae bacterium]|nr:amidase [Rhodospirillaceae bacterium]